MNSTNAWRYQWPHRRLLFPTPPNFILPTHNRQVLNVDGCIRVEEGQWTEKEPAVLPKEAAMQRRKLWATNRDRYSVPQQPGPSGGFSRRTTRPGRQWGSTETVPLCTDTAGGDSCHLPLHGKQAIDHDAILHTKMHCSKTLINYNGKKGCESLGKTITTFK